MHAKDTVLEYKEGRRENIGITSEQSNTSPVSIDNNQFSYSELDPTEQESEGDLSKEDALVKHPTPPPKVIARSFHWHYCCIFNNCDVSVQPSPSYSIIICSVNT